MSNETHQAIIIGLAEDLNCSCVPIILNKNWPTVGRKPLPHNDGGITCSSYFMGQYKWKSPKGLELTVSISAGNLRVYIPNRLKPIIFELANPCLVERISKVLDTYHRLIDIGDEAANIV